MAEASRGVKFEAAKKEFLCVTSPSLPRPSIVPCIDPNPHAFILLATIANTELLPLASGYAIAAVTANSLTTFFLSGGEKDGENLLLLHDS